MVESLQQLKATFDDQGFVVVPGMLPQALRKQLLGIAAEHLAMKLAPVEYEVDVHYPGFHRMTPQRAPKQLGGCCKPTRDTVPFVIGVQQIRSKRFWVSSLAMVRCCCPSVTTIA